MRFALAFVPACLLLAACGESTPPQIAPQITTQPASLTVLQGASATFTVVATGSTPLAYQWKRGGADVAGATSSSYTLASAAAADHDAQFSVVVTNAAGSVTSATAMLSVMTQPSITTQPESRTVPSGVPATFTAVAAGTSLTYQWRRDGVNIPGATSASYTVGVPLAGDAGASYTVVVSNSLGSVTSSAATLTVSTSGAVRPTSYANAKAFNQGAAGISGPVYDVAVAFGDFFGNGNRDYFTATLVYDVAKPMAEAVPGALEFWRWTGTEYVKDAAKVNQPTGCIHPRKAAVADFNGDQRPDIFVACHGYDASPFPGERNIVLLSQPSGVYAAKAVGTPGFYHNVTAFDVNGDSRVDAVVTNNFASKAVYVFLNDGQGNFTERNDLLPFGSGPYFTVEAADVNGDGRTDLLAGGHDWQGAPTVVLLNNGTGSFASVQPLTLPPVTSEGVVLDFVVLDGDRDGVNEIYVVRTSGGDGTFYKSMTVQKVLWPSRTASVIYTKRPSGWMTWVPYGMPVFSGGHYTLTGHRPEFGFAISIP
jgi:hypothetical protein